MSAALLDRDIRREVQARGWFFASSRDDGPAHIVNSVGIQQSLCGNPFYTRAQRSAKKMCLHCKKKMSALIELEQVTQ